MPQDFEQRLLDRLALTQTNPDLEKSGNNKYFELQKASAQKVQDLQNRHALRMAAQEARSQSLVGMMDIAPDSLAAEAVNLGSEFVSGTTRVLGHMASEPFSSKAAIAESQIDPINMGALNRHAQGKASAQDLALINGKISSLNNPNINSEDADTPLKLFNQMNDARSISRKINKEADFSGMVDTTKRDEFTTGITSAYTNNNGTENVGKLIYDTFEAVGNNKRAAVGYITENIPQIAAALLGKGGKHALTASNAGYAFDNYNQGIENYQKEHGGALPPPEVRQEMATKSAGLMALEQGSDLLTLGATKLLGKSVKDATRATAKSAILGTAEATLLGGTGEFGTEYYQTKLEGDIIGKPTTDAENYVGGVIGAVAGGAIAGGGRGLHEASKLAAQPAILKPSTDEAVTPSQVEAINKAVETGDTADLLNPKSENYAPAHAIRSLFGNSQLETTTPEVKEANVVKANQVVADLENDREAIKMNLSTLEDRRAVIDSLKERQSKLDPENVVKIEQFQDAINTHEEIYADAEKNPLSKDEVLKANTQISKLDKLIKDTSTARDELQQLIHPPKLVEELVKKADSVPKTDVDNTVEINKVITLAMASPDRLSATQASQLADNPNNGLTETHRNYLRQFSEARVAENELMTMSEVSQDILVGKKNKGIEQYRANLGRAISIGNQKSASNEIRGIQNFARSHRSKAETAQQALNLGLGTQIINDGKGNWSINNIPMSPTELSKNGGLAINSAGLVSNIQKESQVLIKSLAEMRSAYDLKFAVKPIVKKETKQEAVQPVVPSMETVDVKSKVDDGTSGETQNKVEDPLELDTSKTEIPTVTAEQPGEQPVQATKENTSEITKQTVEKYLNYVANPPEDYTVANVVKARLWLENKRKTETDEDILSDIGITIRMMDEKLVGDKEDDRLATKFTYDTESHKAVVVNRNGNYIDTFDVKPEFQGNGLGAATLRVLENQIRNEKHKSVFILAKPESVNFWLKQGYKIDGKIEEGENISMSKSLVKETKDKTIELNESTPVVESVTVTNTVVESNKLIVMEQKEPTGTAYKLRNLLAEFFTQTTNNTFNKIPEDLNDKQTELVNLFKDKVSKWGSIITSNLPKSGKREFFYKDLSQYFIKDGDVEQQVKDAISYAAINWIMSTVTRPRFNGPEEINAILKRDETTQISPYEYSILGNVGANQNAVISSMGQVAIQALGIKPNKDAKSNLASQLNSHIGAHVFKLLLDLDIVESTIVSGEDMAAMTQDEKTNKNASFPFIKLVYDESENLPAQTTEIINTVRGTQGILDKMFSVESSLKEPTFEPVKYTQVYVKGTKQLVPKKVKKILEQENAVASYVHPGMWNFISTVNNDLLLEIAGGEEIENKHISNQPGIKSTNDALQRQIDNFKKFIDESMLDINTPMYFEHVMWKPQRVGISTNLINPQTSKVHRHSLYRKEWDSTIDRTDPKQMESFLLRVGEGLGVKTDKKSNNVSMEAIKLLLPTVTPGVDALVHMLQNQDITTMSQKHQEAISAAVKVGGENMHSLSSLMALAQYKIAKIDDKQFFNVQLMGEVDGVTNGPMLSHLALGAANNSEDLFKVLNKGGFYEVGNEYQQYNLWREAEGHFDLYETTAGHMVSTIQSYINKGIANKFGKVILPAKHIAFVMPSIYAFTGELADKNGTVKKDGRNIIKTPLTAMMFGSSIGNTVNSMAEKFIESIYTKIEDTAAGKENSIKTSELIAHINNLFVLNNAPKISETLSISELMTTPFTTTQLNAIKKTFKDTLGQAVRSTMETDFSTFILRRKQFNTSAQLTHEIYNSVYTAMHDQMLIEQMSLYAEDNSQGIAFTWITVNGEKTRQPLHDLSIQQIESIHKQLELLTPVMNTYMSNDSEDIKSGLYVGKRDLQLSERSTYKGEVKFGKSIPGTKVWSKTKNAYVEQTGLSVNGYEDIASSPGVAMVPMSMHSSDSAIMHNSLGTSGALNIHDAKGVGVNGFQQAAESLNTSTWNVMLNYSPANEIYQTMINTINGYAELLQQQKLPDAALNNLVKALKVIAERDIEGPQFGSDMLSELVTYMKKTAYKADKIKLETMSNMAYIDQYALEGGNYEVTEANREETRTKLSKLTEEIDSKTLTSLKLLDKHLNFKKETKVVSKPVIEEDHTVVIESNSSLQVGESKITSDKTFVDFFTANPETTAKEVLEQLINRYQQDSSIPNSEFNLRLARMLVRSVDPGLRVHYVTTQTQDQEIEGGPVHDVRGWYRSGVQDNIYVLSPEFINSGLTPELLLHELTHASITRLIRSNDPETKQYVDDLKALLKVAQKYVGDNNLSYDFLTNSDEAVNLDEMIAWGMTNQKFQQEVLAKITITTKSKPVSGLQAFINNITGLLFGKWSTKPEINNGMSLLISNATSLIALSSKQNKATIGPVTLAMSNQQTTQQNIDAYTSLDIFDAINNNSLDSSFQEHLSGLLSGIVEKLHGPFGAFKDAMRKTEAGNPLAVWLKAIETGKAPFASRILASGFTGNNQQDFVMEQVEATVRAALDGNEAYTKEAYKALTGLYIESYERLQVGDFLGGDFHTNTMAEAQALYDFVFILEKSNGDRSDYLARFAALGLAHQGFNKLLKVATKVNSKAKPKSFVERLQNIVEDILNFFHSKVTNTYKGQDADIKLTVLIDLLVDIEAKKRHMLKVRAAGNISVMNTVETKTKIFTDAVLTKATSVLNSPKLRKSGNAFVRAGTGLASTFLGGRVDKFLQTMSDMRDKEFKGQLGIVAGLINNLKGPTEVYKELLLNSKQTEKRRVQEIANKSKIALESFVNQGIDLTRKDKESISKVFMRTGMHKLLTKISLVEIETLLDNRKTLDAKITNIEEQLVLSGNLKQDVLYDADALAYYKATGENKVLVLKQNIYQIAHRFGENNQSTINQNNIQHTIDTLNLLVPLYALRHTPLVHITRAKDVLHKENSRIDGNGIELILELHNYLEQQSQKDLFNGNAALMVHGFLPEMYNYRTLLTIANEADGKELRNMGYAEGAVIGKDPADPNTDKMRLYKLEDGGMSPHVTGIVGYGNNKARGTKVDDMIANSAAITKHRQLAQSINKKNRNFSQQHANYMAPVFNESGDIVSWRYLMNESTKDTLLERNNDFDTLLGSLAGSIQGKISTVQQNKIAMTAALEQYESEFATKGASYVLVGPKSEDPELRDIWALLPEQTKQDVKTIWDREGLMVRTDALDIMFGYHKLSVVNMFNRANSERKTARDLGLMTELNSLNSVNTVQKIIIGVVEFLYKEYAVHKLGKTPLEAQSYALKAAAHAAKAENIWQAIVTETKDIIVVKTGLVLVGNIVSNFSMLYLQGVSVSDMIKSSLVAFRGATAYKSDTEELDKLRTLLNTGYTQGQDIQLTRRITVLEDAITRNPVRELIEAGLMPTIVEDLNAEEDIYSYKSIFTKKIEKVTNKLNPTVVKGLRNLYMTHDTKMYKGLSHITQLSDFVARYTLFQHQTTRKVKPLSKKEAIMRASDAFVNYDIPMHRGLQYSDDMGITMFTKYFLYIQHELLRLAKEQPLRVYSTLLLNNFVELGTIALDSSIYGKLGNDPFRAGAFAYPGSLDKLATVNSMLAIIK